jgi:hypothetical protein
MWHISRQVVCRTQQRRQHSWLTCPTALSGMPADGTCFSRSFRRRQLICRSSQLVVWQHAGRCQVNDSMVVTAASRQAERCTWRQLAGGSGRSAVRAALVVQNTMLPMSSDQLLWWLGVRYTFVPCRWPVSSRWCTRNLGTMHTTQSAAYYACPTALSYTKL